MLKERMRALGRRAWGCCASSRPQCYLLRAPPNPLPRNVFASHLIGIFGGRVREGRRGWEGRKAEIGGRKGDNVQKVNFSILS